MRAKFVNEDERLRKWTPEEERRTRTTSVMGGTGRRPVSGTPPPGYKSTPKEVEKKVRKPREKYLTKKQYEDILKGAVGDTFKQTAHDAQSDQVDIGDLIYDMAESMYYDEDIQKYLSRQYERDYGNWPSKRDLIDQLKNDLERYA